MVSPLEIVGGGFGSWWSRWCGYCGCEDRADSHQPKTPAAQTRRRALALYRIEDRVVGLLRVWEGGVPVAFEAGHRGVAGERCAPSTARR